MHVSRRRFVRDAGLPLTFLLARLEGLALPAEADSRELLCALHTGSGFAPFIGSFLGQIQPGSDAFVTERCAAELEAVLQRWCASLQVSKADLQAIAACLSSTLNASLLGKPVLRTLRTHQPLVTEQASFGEPETLSSSAFLDTFRQYLQEFRVLETTQVQISDITALSDEPESLLSVQTEVHYDLAGTRQDGRREQRTGKWDITWRRVSAEQQWFVTHWCAANESRSRLTGAGFEDVTAGALGDIASFHQQMLHGADYWRTVLDGASGIDVYANNGIAAGDYDGDGFDDLYICQAAGLPNRLYRNRGDGTFTDVTEEAGVGVLDGTASALFLDLDNNGLQDLIVVRTTGPLLLINRGDGTFEHKADAFKFARAPQGTFTAVAAADYNGDGLLDLYFCLYSYYQGLSEYQFPRPYYDAQNGPPNFLFKNLGNHTFEDVTVSSGIAQNNNRYSFACTWNDFDQDGHPDLYVANDFGRKNLYHNRGDGTFTDVSATLGVEDPGAGMSVCWFDYDNDGKDDLYVANMWVAEGKRVSEQKNFLPNAPEEVRRIYRKHADGNSLFHNVELGKAFRDATDTSNTRVGGWSWSADAWDLDHDGFPDLYVTNGFVSGPNTTDLSSFFWRQVVARSLSAGGNSTEYEDAWSAVNEFLRSDYTWSGYQRNNLYLNNGDGSFTEAGAVLGLNLLDDSRSFALTDLDQDGRVEIVVKSRTSPQVRILKNRMSPLPPSIRFALQGSRSNRDAIGAVVELTTTKGRQRRTVAAGAGFLAQHSKVLSFGLEQHGQHNKAEAITAIVHWPSGAKQQFGNLPADHTIKIVEGTAAFKALPFRPSPAYATIDKPVLPDDLSAPVETWLVDPILAPQFSLPDHGGIPRRLADAQGKPLALVFFRAECAQSRRQLQALHAAWPQWQRQGLGLLALCVDAGASETADEVYGFPVLSADAATSAVYSIFYRYLFERRRDMPLPAMFLVDALGNAIKVYSGFGDPAQVLHDSLNSPSTPEARYRRATPFEGQYFGGPLHHNYFTYGVAYFRYGYLDQALASFQQAIVRDPAFAGAYYNAGLIYIQKKQTAEAKANLKKAVELDPANANAWNNLGVVYGGEKQYGEALTSFQQALTLRPGHLLALQNLVKLLEFQGHTAQARELLQKAIANDSNEAPLHVALALLLVQANDLPQARQELEAAVKLQPCNVEALNGLGVVLMKMGDTDQAMECFQQCLQIAPAYDRPYLNIALLDLRAGNSTKAHDLLTGYLEHHPDSSDIRRALKEIDRGR